jgi:hypothetical protein
MDEGRRQVSLVPRVPRGAVWDGVEEDPVLSSGI